MEAEQPQSGLQGKYHWFDLPEHQLALDELESLCPSFLRGKQIVCSCWDSGPLVPTGDEVRAGWTRQGELAVSPIIDKVGQVPWGDGYEEWFVAPEHIELIDFHGFVNRAIFRLGAAIEPDHDTTWCSKLEVDYLEDLEELQRAFWEHIETVMPETWIGDGHRFSVITRHEPLVTVLAEYARVEV